MNIIKNTIKYKRFIIPYRIFGVGDTCLLCINGTLQNMGIWRLFISRFSKRFRVVIFDFPHQGSGDILLEPFDVSFDEQTECVEQVMNQITHFDSLYVYGASWGAVIAAAYSANNSTKVNRLILGNCTVIGNEKLDEIITKGLEYSNDEPDDVVKLMIKGFGESIPDTLKSKFYRQTRSINAKHAEAFRYHSTFVQKVNNLDEIVDFSKIRAKTLVIYGEKDEITNFNDVYTLQKKIKNSTFTTIKQVGHYLHLEDPSVMDIYDEFFT